MSQNFKVVTYNTESGSRPGFHDHLQQYITQAKPDVIALQEVHRAGAITVPITFMPIDPGKREYPMRLHLYYELLERYADSYNLVYCKHITGIHDLEPATFVVDFGQLLLVRKATWSISFTRSGHIYGQPGQFNMEATGGTPCSKAAVSALLQSKVTGTQVLVTNVHGFWSQHGKVDILARFTQNLGIAHQMKRVLDVQPTPYVLCAGDLNYRSDMQALEHLRSQRCFGDDGRVLNHQFGINLTRTNHYSNWKREPEADFMIASAQLADAALSMKSYFDVPSDHALLEATFKIV